MPLSRSCAASARHQTRHLLFEYARATAKPMRRCLTPAAPGLASLGAPDRAKRGIGRVRQSAGGFGVKRLDGKFDYILLTEPGEFELKGGKVNFEITKKAA